MDRPFDVIVVGLLRNQATIAKEIVKDVTQFRELRGFLLFGGTDRTISIKGIDEGGGLTLATDTLPQRFLICSSSCLTSSGKREISEGPRRLKYRDSRRLALVPTVPELMAGGICKRSGRKFPRSWERKPVVI